MQSDTESTVFSVDFVHRTFFPTINNIAEGAVGKGFFWLIFKKDIDRLGGKPYYRDKIRTKREGTR
jgi:hypothetical protein